MDKTVDTICMLCNEDLESKETVTLTEKGVKSLQKAAQSRQDSLEITKGQKVHTKCRRQYTNPKVISLKRKAEEEVNEKPSLRSDNVFSFKSDCLFCGKSIAETCRQKQYSKHFLVRTQEFQTEIQNKAKERNDEWGNEVLARIEFSRDLHASDAMYHQRCSINFRNGREKPHDDMSKKRRTSTIGRTKDVDREDAFMEVVKYLECNDNEQCTLQTLVDKMEQILDGQDGFSIKYMKMRLQEYFGDQIMITNIQRKENIVTFREKATKILHDFHSLPNFDDPEQEKMKIIEVAAKLVKSDIKGLPSNKDIYPSSADIASAGKGIEFLPESLKKFLAGVFSGRDNDVKVASVGQAIIQAARPRLIISPLQLGLGVQLHHHYGSRHLIETLYNLGFCSSYTEVQRYEQSAAVTNNSEIPGYIQGRFVQYVADNVDHNIQTSDGKDTFHGMGIVAAVTPSVKINRQVPRVKVSQSELEELGKIKIHTYSAKEHKNIQYHPLDIPTAENSTYGIDILWKSTWPLKDDRMSWNGMMQMVNNGEHPGQSSVVFMPMIDMNPSDETCIYSTLMWVSEHAKRYNVNPVITFDQPLWYKANQIIESEPTESAAKRIVVRLGGFHTEMSFLGAIGYIMGDTGLQELLSTVYAENAVSHMLSGKAVSRALRGHGLVHMALQTLLVSEVFNMNICKDAESDLLDTGYEASEESKEYQSSVTLSDTNKIPVETVLLMKENTNIQLIETRENYNTEMAVDLNNNNETEITTIGTVDTDLKEALQLLDDVIKRNIDTEEACKAPVIQRIETRIDDFCKKARERSRTAKLWIQYIEMVELLRIFIKAERTGNWQLHLSTLRRMLPFFTASGHNLYAKSVYLYLLNMQKLPQTHPDLYQYFQKGFHVVRRSNRYWAGLPTDLVIEQVLMRSLKSVGGLTRGRGMTDAQRAVWILSRPATSDINEAMQNISGTLFITSEQHKDCEPAIKLRDQRDTEIMLEYLYDRNPFASDNELKSISSGVLSQSSNADQAREIGENIVSKMVGKTVKEFVFKKKDKVVQMNDKDGIRLDGETVKLDPQLLFQRLVSAAQRTSEDIQPRQLFSYELCTHPPAIFESPRLMRAADKPALANALKTNNNPGYFQIDDQESVCHVIDGGMLLQWLPWENGKTYSEICDMYVSFVNSKFKTPTVVFDGYEGGPNTKDNTHARRSTAIVGMEVRFNAATKFHGKKKLFLSNYKNKTEFIKMLSCALNEDGIQTSQATNDADVLIVLTAVRLSLSSYTILVGDDTDLLVLLCYHASMDSRPIYFQPRPKPHRGIVSWDIHKLKTDLGEDVCLHILFIHAFLGCDTTSKLFGIGKGLGIRYFEKK